MKINGMNLWINGDKNGGPAKYMNHSCNPNCELVQWGVDGLQRMCFFAKKNIKSEWSSPSITIGIGQEDRFKQFACVGQIIVTDILRKKM
jgi:hypothetical protein